MTTSYDRAALRAITKKVDGLALRPAIDPRANELRALVCPVHRVKAIAKASRRMGPGSYFQRYGASNCTYTLCIAGKVYSGSLASVIDQAASRILPYIEPADYTYPPRVQDPKGHGPKPQSSEG